MPKTDRFVEFAREQFAALGVITARSMMGGWCLYCDGVVFALVASGVLYLKADSLTIPKYEARGLRPFRPFADKPDVMRYFQAPPEIYEDSEAMREWVGGAVEAGHRAKRPARASRPRAPRSQSARGSVR
jgi:DNA transformation protein